MIVVCGEALIDLVAEGEVMRPHVGGGPFNAAVALARLGTPAGFLGRLSSDPFGMRIRERLTSSGVSDRYLLTGPEPTPLAVVNLNARGEAEYSFYLEGTADRLVTLDVLPPLGAEVIALHFGTLSLVTEPAASTFEALMVAEYGRRLVMLDPNVRPAVIGSRTAYMARLERWIQHADIVKLSEADAAWLRPDLHVSKVADWLRGLGAPLVIVTRGAEGAVAVGAKGSAEVPTPKVRVVDTVGAGDAFGAGVLRWLWDRSLLAPTAVAGIGSDELAGMLTFASAVAALACTRAGADPPGLDEVRRLVLSSVSAGSGEDA